jgi:RimJ/RimL family protein N-acetyltransferase
MSTDGTELIRGTYVTLREMREADAPLIVAWRNRDDVKRWLIRWEPLTLEAQIRWFRGAKAQGDILLMFETAGGEPVGTGSVYGFDRPRKCAEWGRLCAARISGQPHPMIEACYLVHRLCFEVLGVWRLHGALASNNRASYRLNRFLGYADEGLRRQHWAYPDGYRDVIELGLLAEDFACQRPAIEARLYRDLPVPAMTAECMEFLHRTFWIPTPFVPTSEVFTGAHP